MSPQTGYPLSWPLGWKRTLSIERRSGGNMRCTVTSAAESLYSELERLGARDVVVSSNVELRLDGRPSSRGWAGYDPGVAVYFTLRGKPRVLACDRYGRPEFNLRAIAKHVEALRGIERWGVGTIEQAFTGYAALPEQGTVSSCWSVLGLDPANVSVERVQATFRELAKVHHPDAGGTAEAFSRLVQAREDALRTLAASA